jgi:hypothetical protein
MTAAILILETNSNPQLSLLQIENNFTLTGTQQLLPHLTTTASINSWANFANATGKSLTTLKILQIKEKQEDLGFLLGDRLTRPPFFRGWLQRFNRLPVQPSLRWLTHTSLAWPRKLFIDKFRGQTSENLWASWIRHWGNRLNWYQSLQWLRRLKRAVYFRSHVETEARLLTQKQRRGLLNSSQLSSRALISYKNTTYNQ